MKKFTALLLAVLLAAGTVVWANPFTAPFYDTRSHWAGEYIAEAYEMSIISGVGGGLFDPDGAFTVAQAVTVAARIHMLYSYGGLIPLPVLPVSEAHWADAWAEYLRQRNLTGYQLAARFDSPVTRAEAMWIWSGIVPGAGLGALPDVTGLGGANPGGTLTRAEAAAMLMPLLTGATGADGAAAVPGEDSAAETAGIEAEAVPGEMPTRVNFAIANAGADLTIVAPLAGTGTAGFSDGAAEVSSFLLPFSLAHAPDGGLIVFDTFNNALRSVRDGQVETLAGELTADGLLGFPQGGYRNGTLEYALFDRPTDGVFVGGALFVADSGNHVIRRVADGMVTTFAGAGQAGFADGTGGEARFNTPMAIAADAEGNLYVADTLNNAVRRITPDGVVTTLAIGAVLNQPMGIAVSREGGVIVVADTGSHVLRRFENGVLTTIGHTTELDEDGDPEGGYIDGAPEEAMFNLPRGLAFADAGRWLFVADSGNNVIRVIDGDNRVFTAAGTGEPGDYAGPSSSAEFNQPFGVAAGGRVYIADTSNNLIKTLD